MDNNFNNLTMFDIIRSVRTVATVSTVTTVLEGLQVLSQNQTCGVEQIIASFKVSPLFLLILLEACFQQLLKHVSFYNLLDHMEISGLEPSGPWS